MKAVITALALAVVATPAFAELKPGDKAPDFTAPGFQAGKPLTFDLAKARKAGPVVVYFFPAAETKGCNLEAHLFAESADKFKAQGASIIGVTAGNLDKLQAFSADTEKCSGKFPVAGDPDAKIAKQYDALLAIRPGYSSRTSYVVAPDGKIAMVHSDLDPTHHVTKSLEAVAALSAHAHHH